MKHDPAVPETELRELLHGLPQLDVDPASASRIHRAGRRVLLAHAGRARRPVLGRVLELYEHQLELPLLTATAGAYLLWTLSSVLSLLSG